MTGTSETTATPDQAVIYEKIAIIGVGLIGASTALAARRGKLVGHVTACDADPDAVETSRKLGFADEVVGDAKEAVVDADLVIMAVPVGAMGALAELIVPGHEARCGADRYRFYQTICPARC